MPTVGPTRGRERGRATVVRWMLRCAVAAAVLVVTIVLTARLWYPRLLYPAPMRDAHAPGDGRLLELEARDGTNVHATEFPAPEGAPVLVYFHGNGVVMGDVLWMAREFSRRGLGVVLCEYRGYGLSAGQGKLPSEPGLYDDAEAVLDALTRRGIGPERIVLFGESLGTGVAVEMATRGRGSSVVLVTPYTSIPEVASRFVHGAPVSWLIDERFDSLAKAPRVAAPALVLHGTKDEVVPYTMGVRLTAALRNAKLISVPDGHHNDLFLGDGWRLFDEVARFAGESGK